MKSLLKNKPANYISYTFLHFYRHRLMNWLIFIFIGLLVFIQIKSFLPKELKQCYESLYSTVEQADHYQQYQKKANDLFYYVSDQNYVYSAKLTVDDINNNFANPQNYLDELSPYLNENQSIYYYKTDGTILFSENTAPLELTNEEINNLVKTGYYLCDKDFSRYYAFESKSGWLIEKISVSSEENITNYYVLDYVTLDGFVFDHETLDTLSKDQDSIPSNISSIYRKEINKNHQFENQTIRFELISPINHGILKFTQMKIAIIFPLSYQWEGSSLCAYIPISEIVFDILVYCILPALFCIVLAFFLINVSMHFRKLGRNISEEKNISLPFHCFIQVHSAYQIGFSQLFLGLLIIIASTVLLSLNIFSNTAEIANYRLIQLSTTIDSCNALTNTWSDLYSAPANNVAEYINTMLVNDDIFDEDTFQTNIGKLVDLTFVKEISVYDANGNNEFTSSGHIGYPLSKNADSSQYQLWNLMSGDKQDILYRSNSDAGILYFATSRYDKIGVILITIDVNDYLNFEREMNPTDIISNLGYAESCLFIDQDSTDTYYHIDSYGNKNSYANRNLPILSNAETFCGFRIINNKLCLVDGLGTETGTLFYTNTVSGLIYNILSSMKFPIIFLLLIGLLDFIGSAISHSDSEEYRQSVKKSDHAIFAQTAKRLNLSEDIIDSHKSVWKHSLYTTFVFVLITVALDCILNDSTLIRFIGNRSFEKTFSIFSFSLIAIVSLCVFVVIQILNNFFDVLTKNLPPRTVTTSQMVYSIFKLVVIIWLVLFAANQIGIKTSTILASLGITGLALGMAAKDTLNDMLNGLFIILDGRVQVGDYIDVGGFYGEVTRIGIRTTKVNYYNTERSINNSAMVNVTNLSRGISVVLVSFTVSFDTEIKKVEEIITTSTPRFQEACNNRLKSDVRFLGVTEFKPYGVTCACYAKVDERYRKKLTKKCNRVVKEIFDENGIQFASQIGI